MAAFTFGFWSSCSKVFLRERSLGNSRWIRAGTTSWRILERGEREKERVLNLVSHHHSSSPCTLTCPVAVASFLQEHSITVESSYPDLDQRDEENPA